MSSAKIKKALKDSDLSRAILLLEDRMKETGNYDLKSALDEATSTYRAMLTYLLHGYEDSEYARRREELTRTLFSINDQTDRYERLLIGDKQSRYVSAQKFAQNTSLDHLQQRLEVELSNEEHEDEVCRMFNYVWTSGAWTKGDYETATNILLSDSILSNDKSVFVSAVTLALMEMFDVRKLHFLFDAYLTPINITSQRALVGIIIIVRMYSSRLECFPEIQSRIDLYADDPHFVSEMSSAMLMMQFESITDKVTSKMHNDIIPAIMKGQNGLRKMTDEELRRHLTENGENPDWVDKKLKKSMHEIAELQLEGADVYMSSFRYMKGYSFFNKIAHWFYPFNANSHILSNMNELKQSSMGSVLKLILKNSLFCDNDLYSFYYMLNSVGESQRDLLKEQVSQQISDEEIKNISEDFGRNGRSNKDLCRNYIFDLYRFFSCYPFYNQFDNPFKMRRKKADGTESIISFSPLETPAFAFMKKNREEMQTLAEFFMRKGFYEEALSMYEVIDPKDSEEDANLWQKIGFCLQKSGKEKAAFKTYLRADNLLPDSRWTMTHIAQLAQKLENYDTAIDYYDMLLQQDTDNLKFVTNKAICQMKLSRYDDAITTLFKANYLDEESVDIRCLMIQCYVFTSQLDKANDMIADIITNTDCPIEIRILNALLAMKLKSAESAFYYVRESMSYFEELPNDGRSFTNHYNEVLRKYGESLGMKSELARMLLDSVKLDIR